MLHIVATIALWLVAFWICLWLFYITLATIGWVCLIIAIPFQRLLS